MDKISTGIKGLDEITHGGLLFERSYLVRGGPGSGKTTLGIHYLIEGVKNDEKALLITLTETKEKIITDAKNRNLNINNIEFLDLSPDSTNIKDSKEYDVFPANEVEKNPLFSKILDKINDTKPDRVFFDGITQIKYLTKNSYKFRKNILSMISFIVDNNITLLLSSETSKSNPDDDLQYLVDGVINLNREKNNRTISISKYRGSDYENGKHDLSLNMNGLKIYSNIQINENNNYSFKTISSGVPELDQLLNGGLETNTTTVITGPSGVGKTTLAIQFMKEASGRGEKSIVYSFEESSETILNRCNSINIPIKEMISKGSLKIKKINPLQYSPGKFFDDIRNEVENKGASIVMIDSISGFRLSFKKSKKKEELVRKLHNLSEFLKNEGASVFIINEVEEITGTFKATDYGISYMADNIIFLRYLEMKGELRKSIGVLKKRLSDFENKMRHFEITSYGIKVGEPLEGLRGILTGNPEFINE